MSSLTDVDVERLGRRVTGDMTEVQAMTADVAVAAVKGDMTEVQAMTADVAVAAVKKMLHQHHYRCKI